MSNSTPPVALTIAGSDSSGGAGIAADLHTFNAHRVFGTIAITAVTAQNTEKVRDVVSFDPRFVQSQIDAVLDDFTVAAAKTGMLATIAIIESLTERSRAGRLPRLVVDPVMVSSSGSTLFEGDGQDAYRRLLATAFVVTPNLAEAEVLCGRSIRDAKSMREAAQELHDLGGATIVVKGGHLEGDDALDIAYDGEQFYEFHEPRVATDNVHGTGCTLSAAIAANLALGHGVIDSVQAAKRYVASAIASSAQWNLGTGPGPIDHFGLADFNS